MIEGGVPMLSRVVGVVLAMGLAAASAMAQTPSDKVKVGIIVTLSGPGAVLGQQARDGFCWR